MGQAPVAVEIQPPDPARTDAAAGAAPAYAAFTVEYLALLSHRDRAGAEARIGRAEKDPVLKPLAAQLQRDRKLLEWLGDLEKSLPLGIEKLKEVEDFELLRSTGEALRVGRQAAYRLVEFKDEVLFLGSKELSFPLPLAKLSAGTLEKLADLGLGEDAKGLLRKAFKLLLGIGGAGGGEGAPALGAAQAALERAGSAGAPMADVDLLSFKLDALRGSRESFIEQELTRFDRLFSEQNWAEAEQLGSKLLAEAQASATLKKRAAFRAQVAAAARKGLPATDGALALQKGAPAPGAGAGVPAPPAPKTTPPKPSASGPLREYTLTFQEGAPIPEAGVEKYAGTRNVFLYGYPGFEDRHMAVKDGMLLYGGTSRLVLIAFRLFETEGGILPANTEILEAKLFMQKGELDYGLLYELRACLARWNPEEASWNAADKGKPWNKPGGDLSEAPVSRTSTKAKDLWFEADVAESLRNMQKEGTCFGWGITAYLPENPPKPYPGILGLPSSSHFWASARPKLVLKVRCAAFIGEKPKPRPKVTIQGALPPTGTSFR